MGRPNKGGCIRTFGGVTQYRLIRITRDGRSRQVLEHRHVMEQHLGRKLLKEEVVHHKDGNGLNNSIDNLELMSFSQHQNEHLETGPRKWSLETALRMRAEGMSLEDIGAKLGVAWTGIRKAFIKRGVPTCDRRRNKPQLPSVIRS